MDNLVRAQDNYIRSVIPDTEENLNDYVIEYDDLTIEQLFDPSYDGGTRWRVVQGVKVRLKTPEEHEAERLEREAEKQVDKLRQSLTYGKPPLAIFDAADFEVEAEDSDEIADLKRDLARVFNRYSCENTSGTPDFILADIALNAIKNWNDNIQLRAEWRGESTDLPAFVRPADTDENPI